MTSISREERVARAIFAAGFSPIEDRGLIDQCWDDWTEDRERAFHHARAAIAALEPNERLIEALAEVRELRGIIAEFGYCTPDASLDFMRLIPAEVKASRSTTKADQ